MKRKESKKEKDGRKKEKKKGNHLLYFRIGWVYLDYVDVDNDKLK